MFVVYWFISVIMRIYERMRIYYKASWCNGRIVGFELVRLWFTCRLECPFSLRCGRGSVSWHEILPAEQSCHGGRACKSCAIVTWSSFPSSLRRDSEPQVPVLCPALLRFRVWSQISPCLHQFGDPSPSQLQNPLLLWILKNTVPNQLCTAEHLIKLY